MSITPKIKGLYHFAFPCRDAEETRRFYEDILNMKLAACMQSDRVPSTGEEQPYAHFFLEMGDGSYLAFFDLGRNEMPLPSPNTPAWVMHFAMEVDSLDEVLEVRDRLRKAGVAVTDIVDHDFIKSVYFLDPNGLRLEVTTRTEEPGFVARARAEAPAGLDAWNAKKKVLTAGA